MKGVLSIIQAIQKDVCIRQVGVINSIIRLKLESLLGLGQSTLVLSKVSIGSTEQIVGNPVSRVALTPHSTNLNDFFNLSSSVEIILSRNEESLSFACSPTQLVSLSDVLISKSRLSHIGVLNSQR